MDQEKEVLRVINMIRPYIQRDGGDVEFVKLEDGVVYVKMLGACAGCMSLDDTLKLGIETTLLDEVPGIVRVELVTEETDMFEYWTQHAEEL